MMYAPRIIYAYGNGDGVSYSRYRPSGYISTPVRVNNTTYSRFSINNGLSRTNGNNLIDKTIGSIGNSINSVSNYLGSGLVGLTNNFNSWSPYKINLGRENQYTSGIRDKFFASANAYRPAFGPWVASDMTGGAGAFRTAQAKGEQMITNQMLARNASQQPQVIYRYAPGTTLSTLGGSNNSAWRSQNLSNISGQSKNKRYANGMNAFAINSSTTTGLNKMR